VGGGGGGRFLLIVYSDAERPEDSRSGVFIAKEVDGIGVKGSGKST